MKNTIKQTRENLVIERRMQYKFPYLLPWENLLDYGISDLNIIRYAYFNMKNGVIYYMKKDKYSTFND